jgi:F-type H+-transporting ATPase subunit a
MLLRRLLRFLYKIQQMEYARLGFGPSGENLDSCNSNSTPNCRFPTSAEGQISAASDGSSCSVNKVIHTYTRGADSVQSANSASNLQLEDTGTSALNNAALESPLDQFSIHPIMDLHIGNYYFSFTNPSLSMMLTLGLVLLLVFVVTKKGGGKSVPNAWQSLVELIYDFVPNLVNEQIGGLSGNVKQKFFPRISVTFTFLLFCNLQGMIPFSFTVTSHFLITLALSFSLFIGITIVGFQRHGLHFFSFLLPAGVPLPLAPFLVLLELISHCFRALSSGIRLFANMMAGHSSVKILSGFAWTMLFLNNIFYFIGDLGPLLIVLALTGLELGVAISQAHVSTISICIYLNDATNLHQNESFHN